MDHSPIFQIKITLLGTKPPVWRRIQVNATLGLGTFHHVLGKVMGWEDGHLHEFSARGFTWGPRNFLEDPWDHGDGPMDERKALVADLFTKAKSKARYVYDFGDEWTHDLVLEKILPEAALERVAVCLDGARACPPEDCGGVGGYDYLLEVLADPDHPDHEEKLDWLGGHFDPEAFSVDAVNKAFAPRPAKKRAAKKKAAG